MTHEEALRFWLDSAEDNHRSMENMFHAGEYMWSLFIGHLVLEKLLKALHVKTKGAEIPRTHDLLRLAMLCGLQPTEEQKDALQLITLFNIESRYEDYKRDFYGKCTKEFAEASIAKIEEIRLWLRQEISR